MIKGIPDLSQSLFYIVSNGCVMEALVTGFTMKIVFGGAVHCNISPQDLFTSEKDAKVELRRRQIQHIKAEMTRNNITSDDLGFDKE